MTAFDELDTRNLPIEEKVKELIIRHMDSTEGKTRLLKVKIRMGLYK